MPWLAVVLALAGCGGAETASRAAADSRRSNASAEPVAAAAGPAGAEIGTERPRRPGRARRRSIEQTAPPLVDADLEIPAAGRFGDGFLVWESSRAGNWRIWTRRLDGSGLRQLSREEGDRQHCCAHLAPDGRHVVYLSVGPDARHAYPKGGLVGELRLLAMDDGTERVLAPVARGYGDHRVAVWRTPTELVYIDAGGRTTALDVATGRQTVLAIADDPEHGWLLDATLRWATSARPSFAPFDRAAGRVARTPLLRGCEPYFSHDGRWGYFVERGGGPVRSFHLETRTLGTVLERADSRLPAGYTYVYFPMLSRDGSLFAFSASRGEHDQFRADYDVFVARFDMATFELIERPVRFTGHPGTDRFPDLWARPATVRSGR